MKCSKCNSIVPNESKFCHCCGHEIEKNEQKPISADTTVQNTTPRTQQYTYTPISPRRKQPATLNYTPLFIGIVVAVIIIIVAIVNNIDNDTSKNNDDYASDDHFSDLTPVKEPRSGEILLGYEYDDASAITVTASDEESCVVKLKTSRDTTVVSFYVRAGDTVTVGVPKEELYVYFAEGEEWYGEDNLFGEDTGYSMDDEICDFSEKTWKYTLTKITNGNFKPSTIDADDF